MAWRFLIPIGLAVASLVALPCSAQKLPPASGTTYKCEVDGQVAYSDVPCLGATRVDTTPTRGVNKSTGQTRIGVDVRQEMHDEQMADALKPLGVQNADQWTTLKRRAGLAPEARARCNRLDGEIARAEATEARARDGALQPAQARLLRLRRAFFDLRC